MKYHAKETQNDIIDTLNSFYRYQDDLDSIDNICFEEMIHRKCTAELQLNNANSSDTEGTFNGIISS